MAQLLRSPPLSPCIRSPCVSRAGPRGRGGRGARVLRPGGWVAWTLPPSGRRSGCCRRAVSPRTGRALPVPASPGGRLPRRLPALPVALPGPRHRRRGHPPRATRRGGTPAFRVGVGSGVGELAHALLSATGVAVLLRLPGGAGRCGPRASSHASPRTKRWRGAPGAARTLWTRLEPTRPAPPAMGGSRRASRPSPAPPAHGTGSPRAMPAPGDPAGKARSVSALRRALPGWARAQRRRRPRRAGPRPGRARRRRRAPAGPA